MNLPKRNYQKELERLLLELTKKASVPTLFLHSCCAPCSSYVLEYLSQYFSITIGYYNPNIYPPEEFAKRAAEQKRLIAELPAVHPITFREEAYDPQEFYALVRGLEQEPEGGKRCLLCYRQRMEYAAKTAKAEGFAYFTTTLSISPLKNADILNEIGEDLQARYGVRYLPSDFKKKDGYRRSVQLSEQYGLYRQNYCGCVFSVRNESTSAATAPATRLPEPPCSR